MDTFVEQIVVKRKTATEWTIAVGVWVLFLVVAVALFLILGGMGLAPVSVFAVFGAGYGAWWLSTNQNREFEYSITNGSIDVDEIIAQRKRKRLVSVNGAKIETAGKYTAAVAHQSCDRFVMAAPCADMDGLWYFTYHSKKGGHTKVVFAPDERVLTAFVQSLPSLLRMELNKEC